METGTSVDPSSAGRLRTVVIVDVATTLAAAVFVMVVYVTAVPSGYLALAGALVGVSAVVMAVALRPLRRGQVRIALRWLGVANWVIAVAAATIATFAWPVLVLTAFLPSVLAASIIGGRELAAYVAMSVAVALAVVLSGLLQDFSGLSDEVPLWLRDLVLIVFVPSLAGLLALIVVQNSISMQGVVAAVEASRVELAEQAAELRRSRARVVAATDRERRRIERDLHDGAQQRLIGIGIGLSRVEERFATDPGAAMQALDRLRKELRTAHEELRSLAHGVYPSVLTEHGLEAAVQSAADRCPLPVTVDLDGIGRHPPEVESALYFCCVEALQNTVKHAAGSAVTVACGTDGSNVWISVADDGVGFDPDEVGSGSGIVGLRDRLGAVGGRLELTSSPARGVVLRGVVPSTSASS